jgi:hypothetical protein
VAFSQYLNINYNVSLRSAVSDVDMQLPGFALFIYLSNFNQIFFLKYEYNGVFNLRTKAFYSLSSVISKKGKSLTCVTMELGTLTFSKLG